MLPSQNFADTGPAGQKLEKEKLLEKEMESSSCFDHLQTLTVWQLYGVGGPPAWLPSSSLIRLVNGVAQAHVLQTAG